MLWYCLFLLLCWSSRLNAQDNNCTEICETNAICDGEDCVCDGSSFSPTGSNTDCRSRSVPDPLCSDPMCIFCGASSNQPCMWCIGYIFQDSCVRNCTGTISIRLIPNLNIPVSHCDGTGGNSSSLPQWAIIVIIVVVVLIVITAAVLIMALVVRALQRTSRGVFEVVDSSTPSGSVAGTMRTKRSDSFSFFKKNKNRPELLENVYAPTDIRSHDTSTDQEEEDEMDDIDGDDETIFKHKVEKMRPQSTVFLQMLNDMRRRSKELPEGSPAEEQYRKVMRDVTRLLYILNKKPSRLQMPPDGLELMRWSQKILRKYQSTAQTKDDTLQRSTETRYVPSEPTNTSDENVFLGKLAFLRDHSAVFLQMLNELRRKLKELRPEIPITRQYKVIVKDLSRLLELINKDPDEVKMPHDGLQLVNRAEHLLEGYLAGQGFNPNYEDDGGESYSEDTTHF